ncbi:MAG: glycine cleavage system protein GcvH [Acidobacteria bacterium]|nr:glycine cleavage system protein GcvH [Acidobacteriota bacterium]
MYPADLKYTKDHEWIRVADGQGHVGITDYAQEQLGDVVYVELPAVGRAFAQGEQFGAVESVKAVSDLYCPVSGEVVQVNEALADRPETINHDPHGTWLIVVKLSDPGELDALLDAGGYGAHVA